MKIEQRFHNAVKNMKKRGFTNREIGEITGCHQRTISQILRGGGEERTKVKIELDAEVADKLKEAFGKAVACPRTLTGNKLLERE